MDGTRSNPLAAGSTAPGGQPSRVARRAGASASAVGGLGALVGFFLPWLIFVAAVQVGCRSQFVQVEVYGLYGAAIALGAASDTAWALAVVVLLCAGAIVILAAMSARHLTLFRARLLLALSLLGLGALGLLGALAASGRVIPKQLSLYKVFLGFGPGIWVTTGGLALALIGGAVLHTAARPLRQRASIGEIALMSLGIVGLLSSGVASVVAHPAPYPSLNCVQQGDVGNAGDGAVYFTSADGVYALHAANGQVQWSCHNPLGGVVTDSAPTFAGGVLYLNSLDGYVFAIRAHDGAILWRDDLGVNSQNLAPQPSVSPTVGDGLVFGVNSEGLVYALRASDGTRVWATYMPQRTSIMPTLRLANRALIYRANEPGPHLLSAVDARNSGFLWKAQDNYVVAGGFSPGSPMQVVGDTVYDVEYNDGVSLVARSVKDGATRWRYPAAGYPAQIASTVFTVVGDVVYVAQRQVPADRDTLHSTPGVVALRASDGAVLWRTPAPDVVSEATPAGQDPQGAAARVTLTADSNGVYLAVTSNPGGAVTTVYSFDAQHGSVLWRHDVFRTAIPATPTGTLIPTNMSAPVVTDYVAGQPQLSLADGIVFLLDRAGAVSAFDARTGSARWSFSSDALPSDWTPAPGAITTGSAAAGGSATGLLYVATSRLYAINPSDGAVRWQFTPDQPVTPYARLQGYAAPIISPPTLAP